MRCMTRSIATACSTASGRQSRIALKWQKLFLPSNRTLGLNSKIKALKRCSYGIKNLASLFRRIWLGLMGYGTFAH
jgi:hypothetical protein